MCTDSPFNETFKTSNEKFPSRAKQSFTLQVIKSCLPLKGSMKGTHTIDLEVQYPKNFPSNKERRNNDRQRRIKLRGVSFSTFWVIVLVYGEPCFDRFVSYEMAGIHNKLSHWNWNINSALVQWNQKTFTIFSKDCINI